MLMTFGDKIQYQVIAVAGDMAIRGRRSEPFLIRITDRTDRHPVLASLAVSIKATISLTMNIRAE